MKTDNIIDLRIFFHEPTLKEITAMHEYWDALREKFKKPVEPHIIISD